MGQAGRLAGGKGTILVSGMIAGVPHHGGATWAVLQYLLGFMGLGYTVYFAEPVTALQLQPAGESLNRSANARYFREVMAAYGLQETSALLLEGTDHTVGLPYQTLCRAARQADVVINIAGMLGDQELVQAAPLRVYLDIDPAFTQLWQSVEGIDMRFQGHNRFLTVGQAIGDPSCPIPTCGVHWIPTLQPVVLDRWHTGRPIRCDAFTTVGNWRGYGSIEYRGTLYGQKAHSLRRFVRLPTRTEERFALALSIHPDETRDLEALSENRWVLLDPQRVAHTPRQYQSFIEDSKGELCIAKSGYVLSRCGWFSDRSACYLASGRPVIAQETGFSRFLPSGFGLLPFQTEDDVLAAVGAVNTDYRRHSLAAREVAEEYFDSRKVLSRILTAIGGDI
jgi:hypothetical protein